MESKSLDCRKFHRAATIADQFKAIDAAETDAHATLTKRFTARRLALIASYQDDPELTRMVTNLLMSESSDPEPTPDTPDPDEPPLLV